MKNGTLTDKKAWTTEQAWHLVTQLAKSPSGSLKYDEVILNELFKVGGEDALLELEKMQMISMDRNKSHGSKPSTISVGAEVTLPALQALTTDKTHKDIKDWLDRMTLKVQIDQEKDKIKRIENQLKTIAKLRHIPPRRESYLLDRAEAAQKKIEELEQKSKDVKRNLKGGYLSENMGWIWNWRPWPGANIQLGIAENPKVAGENPEK